MAPGTNTLLSLILLALGLLGVILSLMIQDRKRFIVGLVLAGLIVVVGLVQFGSQSMSRLRWQQRMKEIQQDRKVDLEELRKRLKEKAAEARDQVQKNQSK